MRRTSCFAILWIGLLLATTACGVEDLPIQAARPADTQANLPGHGPIILAPSDATVTPTPFLPQGLSGSMALSNTAVPESSRPWGNFAGPSIWPPIEIPQPAPAIPQPSGQENILLLGDDKLDDPSFRTDAVMLLILKKNEGSASLISFPRDLYVYAPGWTMQRINVIMERGGFKLMAETFAYNFGVRPAYYAQVNLYTMGRIIDALNGIEVNVPVALKDPDYGIDIPAGSQHMDGKTAQLYSQARYTTSDFDRTRRQQEVLQALFLKMISLNGLASVPELYQTFQQDVKTNITLDDITRWLPLAASMKDFSRLERYTISEQQVIPWVVPTSGTDVLLPDRKAILTILQTAAGLGKTAKQ
jgi:LCP family protein required for cell wall assembly